ncbi:MAG: alpha-L-fucosidase, partial [Ferruginibacter sp.]
VDIVSKGGNYLLNIGPGPYGELDAIAYQRLKEIGSWIKINGEAIYGSRMFTVFNEGESIRFTQSKDGKTRYIFLFNFPEKNITLAKIPFFKNDKVQLLGSNKQISWRQTGQGVEISLPASLKTTTDHVWVLKVKKQSF